MEQKLYSEQILEHFGVKGMKWGVRRSDAQLRAADAKRDRKSKNKAESKATVKSAKDKYHSDKQIKSARQRVAARDKKIGDAHIRAWDSKSKAEAQKAVNEMKALAKSKHAKRDIAIASKSTYGEMFVQALVPGGPAIRAGKAFNRTMSMRLLDDVKSHKAEDYFIERKKK